MSVVCSDSCGWLLDSCSHTDEALQRCASYSDGLEQTKYFQCCFKREYFNTLKPHGQIQQNTDILTSGVLLNTAKHSNAEQAKIDLQTRKVGNRKSSTKHILMSHFRYCARLVTKLLWRLLHDSPLFVCICRNERESSVILIQES